MQHVHCRSNLHQRSLRQQVHVRQLRERLLRRKRQLRYDADRHPVRNQRGCVWSLHRKQSLHGGSMRLHEFHRLPDVPGVPDEPRLLERLWSLGDVQWRLLQLRQPVHSGDRGR